MKIFFPFGFSESQMVFMRRAGYAAFTDPNTGITSYVKRFSGDYYPRFHVYIERNKDNRYSINLHLDQKKPSYAGAHSHSADYEGGVVDVEARRLQGLIKNQMDNQQQEQKIISQPKPQGFFAKLFK